ncbi:protein of unknown function [Pseudomonas sp. JV551A1]|nr:protein of unknown function [Pseudomonas sp. JV551A1]
MGNASSCVARDEPGKGRIRAWPDLKAEQRICKCIFCILAYDNFAF